MSTTQNKRRRLCGPKVKTGCQTCKIRRVKCDEARPSCWRCVNTGRRCDGYLHVSYRESSSSDEGSNLGPVARRVITISGSAEERRGFQFFVEQTAPELTGYLSPDFWEYLILQASVAVPSLKHTVIAIGSLHESLMIQKGRMLLEGTEQNEFAIKQYSKAIGHLRRNLAAGSEQSITALMSCLLFVCFDSLRGQMSSALVHLTSGFKILQDSRGESQANDHIIEKNVAPALIRSSVHSVLYFDTRRKDQRLSMMEELLEISSVPYEIPDLFEDIEEARLSLNMTLDQLFKIINLIDEDIPYNAQLPEVFTMFAANVAQLEHWNKAFEAFLARNSSNLTDKQVRGAAIIQIHHIICKTIAKGAPSLEDPRPSSVAWHNPDDREYFDKSLNQVINLSRSLIVAGEADARAGKAPLHFSMDLGIVAPLYYVGVKMRDPEQRLAALELLERVPWKEGLWDNTSCARLVKQFWEMETMYLETAAADPTFDASMRCGAIELEFADDAKCKWT